GLPARDEAAAIRVPHGEVRAAADQDPVAVGREGGLAAALRGPALRQVRELAHRQAPAPCLDERPATDRQEREVRPGVDGPDEVAADEQAPFDPTLFGRAPRE